MYFVKLSERIFHSLTLMDMELPVCARITKIHQSGKTPRVPFNGQP
jgi:hypothetical protein